MSFLYPLHQRSYRAYYVLSMGGLKKLMLDTSDTLCNQQVCIFATSSLPTGHSEAIPDAMKAYFRPICYSAIDEQSVIELTLFSHGFKEARSISERMIMLFKYARTLLAARQLFVIDLRKIKEILTCAGTFRRGDDTVIVESIHLVLQGFMSAADMQVLTTILSDLFQVNEVVRSARKEEDFMAHVRTICEQLNLLLFIASIVHANT